MGTGTQNAVILDLGRVLVRIHDDAILPSLAELADVAPARMREMLAEVEEPFETGAIDTGEALGRLLVHLDRGGTAAAASASERGAWNRVLQRRRRLLEGAFRARFTPISPVVELTHRLAAEGRTLALASNTNPLDYATVERQYPDLLTPFEARIFLSYRLGVMKPDQRFYAHILERLALPASSCVFVDDKEENVEAARRAGMRGIVYNGTHTPVATLRERLERVER